MAGAPFLPGTETAPQPQPQPQTAARVALESLTICEVPAIVRERFNYALAGADSRFAEKPLKWLPNKNQALYGADYFVARAPLWHDKVIGYVKEADSAIRNALNHARLIVIVDISASIKPWMLFCDIMHEKQTSTAEERTTMLSVSPNHEQIDCGLTDADFALDTHLLQGTLPQLERWADHILKRSTIATKPGCEPIWEVTGTPKPGWEENIAGVPLHLAQRHEFINRRATVIMPFAGTTKYQRFDDMCAMANALRPHIDGIHLRGFDFRVTFKAPLTLAMRLYVLGCGAEGTVFRPQEVKADLRIPVEATQVGQEATPETLAVTAQREVPAGLVPVYATTIGEHRVQPQAWTKIATALRIVLIKATNKFALFGVTPEHQRQIVRKEVSGRVRFVEQLPG